MKSRASLWMMVVAAGSLVGAAQAMDDGQDKDALSGPKVQDRSVPGERRTLTGKGDRKDQRADRMPPGGFMRAMHVLRDENAPAELKLTSDQETQIKAAGEEFRGQVKAYVDAHKAEIDELRTSLPPRERGRLEAFVSGDGPRDGGPGGEGRGPRERAGKPGGKKGDKPEGDPKHDDNMHEDNMHDENMHDDAKQGDAPVSKEQAEATREKMRTLMENAPKPADMHAKVMAILSAPQKAAVEKELEAMRSAPPRDAGDGSRRDELRKHLSAEEQEKLKSMSPEERREFIRKKLEERKTKDGGK